MVMRSRSPSSLYRLASAGFELAASVLGFAAVGYAFDRYYESAPRGLLICTGLGLIGGMYNLIRTALKASKQADQSAEESDNNQGS